MQVRLALASVSLLTTAGFAETQPQGNQTVKVGPWTIATTYKADKFDNYTMSSSAEDIIHRTTSGFAVTLSNSTCSFSSRMRWGQSACGFWWKIQTRSSTNFVNAALGAIPTAFTILHGGRANLPSTT
jgi:hypothetical protein